MEVNGKFNSAKIFIDNVEESALEQIRELCNQEFCSGSRIRIMPDVHSGVGCTIGTTMTITDKVVPSLVGVDIGCGMLVRTIYPGQGISYEKIDKFVRDNIPAGMNIRKTPHQFNKMIDLEKLHCANHVDLARAELSLGTLGGGNHFIEIDEDERGCLYLVVHSGSRHLGVEVAKYYQNAGYEAVNMAKSGEKNRIIEILKADGRAHEISAELGKIAEKYPSEKKFAFVFGKLFSDYLEDMKLVQEYAAINRQAIMYDIRTNFPQIGFYGFTTVHNYIDTDSMILRKGAVSAKAGEKFIVPINMRDGSLICIGKGNKDWNFSAPHGAGRIMSRTEAKRKFTVTEFQKQMNGIFTTSVGENTIDESPMAYKSAELIMNAIKPTADIEIIIKPVYNFKADE